METLIKPDSRFNRVVIYSSRDRNPHADIMRRNHILSLFSREN